MTGNIGKFLIIAGGIILITGVIISLMGDKLSWLGRLPGDIRIEKNNYRIYVPLTTMILVSLILSAIIYVIKKLF